MSWPSFHSLSHLLLDLSKAARVLLPNGGLCLLPPKKSGIMWIAFHRDIARHQLGLAKERCQSLDGRRMYPW